MKTLIELEVLEYVLSESIRFTSKLRLLIEEKKNDTKSYSKHRSSVKRAALDLKKELSKITTSTGTYGNYYYNS